MAPFTASPQRHRYFYKPIAKINTKMFYKVKVKDYVRVPPDMFHLTKREAVLQNIKRSYENYISAEFGFVLNVIDVGEVTEGVIIPGDGAGYYQTEFELLTFKTEMNELVYGKIRD